MNGTHRGNRLLIGHICGKSLTKGTAEATRVTKAQGGYLDTKEPGELTPYEKNGEASS